MGLCWPILGLCYAFVVPFGDLLAAFGGTISIPTDSEFWVDVSAILRLGWAFVESFGTLLGLACLKFQPQPKHCSVEVEFWLHFDLMLGHLESTCILCCAGLKLSMWAFPASFWRMNGSCTIYVPKRQLDVEAKYERKGAQKFSKKALFLGT